MSQAEDIEEVISDAELEKRLLECALDGEDVRSFVVTPVGRAVLRKAKDDYMKSAMALVDVDLGSPDAAKLQMKARVSMQLIQYLASIVRDGDSAVRAIEAANNEGQL